MKSADGNGLTFDWPARRRISLLLPGFIVLSIILHALAFYIFQAVYPPSVSILPPPARVGLLMPANPNHQALLHWIEAEDPASVSAPPEVMPRHLFDLPYRPSYAEVRAMPKPAADAPQHAEFLQAKDPLAIVSSAIAPQQKAVAPIQAPKTKVRFSDALSNRATDKNQPIRIATKTAAELMPTGFLIGVDDRGEVRYAFLQTSSGDKAIDQQAEMHITKIQFAHAPEPMTWGFATCVWGNDAYVSQPVAK